MTFGQTIAKTRKDRGLSQRDLALLPTRLVQHHSAMYRH